MNLSLLLSERVRTDHPIRVALIGCGKFATMYLTQARQTAGIHVVGIADLDPARAMKQLATAGWTAEQYAARNPTDAMAKGSTWLTEDADQLIDFNGIDVVVEATGIPTAGIHHCRRAIAAGHHIIMVNVEADVVAGPLLAQEAQAAGVVYSLAWGDQPALICEHVDWARTCGFEVVCAGKGTRYHPSYHELTPDSVWEVLQQYLEIDDPTSINMKMFNSFLDGSKSGIEMSAVCNTTGLTPQDNGLGFPPSSRFDLANVCKPSEDGGMLSRRGTTEVVSSLTRSGEPVPHHLAMGTYVVVDGAGDYAQQCFREYHMLQDSTGRYAALYRPTHMIGMELGVSVASVVLRGEPTGCPKGFYSDVVATAKHALTAGQILDGEGGHCVWGQQMPAADSIERGALPLGLAADIKMRCNVAAGSTLRWADVEFDDNDTAVRARREMEVAFSDRL